MAFTEHDRPDPPLGGDEMATMTAFLDYQRATVLWKFEGLDVEQAATTVASSGLTPAGIVKHLALVEDHWFQSVFLGSELPEPWESAPFEDDPDWDFHSAAGEDPASVAALYEAACDRSRRAVAGVDGARLSVQRSVRRDGHFNLRWILAHMIEETARHNGHLDIIRESIDGLVGE
jgi:uncharacterized damage-inducible protein DinB